MNGIVTLQSSRPVVSSRFRIFMNLHYHSLSKNRIAMDLGILGEFWEHFPEHFPSWTQAVQPIARQIMEGVQQLHDFGIVLAYGIHQHCEDFMLWNPGHWEAWKVEKWIRNGDRTVLRPFLFEENTSQTPNSARYTETCPLRMSWFPQLKDWGRVGSSTKEVFCLPEIHWFGGKVEVEQVDFFPWTYHQRSRSLDFIQSFGQQSSLKSPRSRSITANQDHRLQHGIYCPHL